MGREWYWGGSRSSKRGGGGGGGGGGAEKDTATSGCMCAVFQLFDFPHVQFALNQHHPPSFNTSTSLHPEDLTVPKGVEAPRNSLYSSEGTSLSSITKEEEENLNSPSILKFQMGIQIKTSGGTTSTPDMSSPGTKTPNLVARLMGLDLLPHETIHSPSSTSSMCSSSSRTTRSSWSHSHPLRPRKRRPRVLNVMDSDHVSGTRSLPETPRISSARRSDVDHHPRLSLQINKENIGEEMDFSRLSSLRRKEILKIIGEHEESGKSPSQYARQIVKQVKESVSRKVGLSDITNSNRSRDREDEQSRDEVLKQLKSKRKQVQESKGVEEASAGKQSSTVPSCSPRLRFLESKEQVKSPVSSLPVNVSVKPKAEQKSQESFQKRGQGVHDGYGGRPRPSKKQQEEAFVRPSTATRAMNNINMPSDKKSKKTPLSSNLLNLNNVPSLLPLKKEPSPPKQAVVSDAQESKRRRCSSQLSSCSSQTYKEQGTHGEYVVSTQDTKHGDMPNGGTTTGSTTAGPHIGGGSAAELRQYVTTILFRTGIDNDTPVSFTNWFAPSHPLDPSIFHRLENSSLQFSSQLGQRCNRRLVFHLVDEILVDILRPYINMKPWVTSDCNCNGMQMHGSQLIDMVCSKIQSFPCAHCTLVEDIDALIDKDLPDSLKVQSATAFEEEGEGLVWEIEKDVLDTLIHETAMGLWFSTPYKTAP